MVTADSLRRAGTRQHYEVAHDRVAVRDCPSPKGLIVGAVSKGTSLHGWISGTVGDPWLSLDGPSIEYCKVRAEEAYVLIHGRSLGLGALLRPVSACEEDRVLKELGETPLIAAVRQGSVESVRSLVEARADVHERDGFGETALMEAASQGNVEICQYLLSKNADPSCSSLNGLCAKDLASEHKELDGIFARYAELLLMTAVAQHDEAKVQVALALCHAQDQDLTISDSDGATALHICAAKPPSSTAAASVAELLIEARAVVNASNILGETPLILAVRNCPSSESAKMRLGLPKALLDAHADPNASDAMLRETALMEAASIDDYELVILLLRSRADPARASTAGQTALNFAAGSKEVYEVLSSLMLRNRLFTASLKNTPKKTVATEKLRSHGPTFEHTTPYGCSTSNPVPSAAPPLRTKTTPIAEQPERRAEPPLTSSKSVPEPVPTASKPSPTTPKQPLTAQQRIQEVLDKYPGFVSMGIRLPPDALYWTTSELEMFVGSMGELWPHGRRRASAKTQGDAPTTARCPPPPSVLRPHCQVLGLPDTVKERKALKTAYHAKALQWHPDKNAGNPDAALKFQEVVAAYDFLRNALGFSE